MFKHGVTSTIGILALQSNATTRTRTRRKRAAKFTPLTARGVTAGRNGALRHSPLTAIGVTAERLSDAAAVHNRKKLGQLCFSKFLKLPGNKRSPHFSMETPEDTSKDCIELIDCTQLCTMEDGKCPRTTPI